MSNALERYDDRHLARLQAEAAIIAKAPGLKAEIAGKPDAVAAICLSLDAYGFRPTIPAVNMAFDWILGRAEPSTRFYVALARHHGWRLAEKQPTTRDLAVAIATKPGEEPIERRWTIEDAIESHRLDAWVEDWRTAQQSGKRYAVTYVVRINGVAETWYGDLRGPLPDRLPEWVVKALDDPSRIKRYDAWWNYRTDMMLKSALKRAAIAAIPDVILGAPAEHEFDSPAPARGRPTAGESSSEPDDDIADAEIVDDDEPDASPPHVHDAAPESRGLEAEDDGRPF